MGHCWLNFYFTYVTGAHFTGGNMKCWKKSLQGIKNMNEVRTLELKNTLYNLAVYIA